jgi:hypothetical protein
MADDLVIGGQLGNYLIESVIGRGGMSVVYRAKHARLGTSAALKVLAPELSSDDTFRERFLREAQMAAGIDHPNVVPIVDMGLRENSLYIVMRYVSGGDLKALLATSGPLAPQRALELLRPVARALDAAHAHGLVHRDVKPGNILVQRSGDGEIDHVYLTDFGIAKSSHISGLTRAGGLIGTVEYMAPEQIEGRGVSAQTDVYALAGVFYECITGKIPFERELSEGALPPLGTPEPPSSLRPGLPRALDAVLAKALARDPAERHATCETFIEACRSAIALEAAPAGAGGDPTVSDSTLTPPPGETVAATSAGAAGGSAAAWAPASAGREPAGGGGERWPPVGAQGPPPPAEPPAPAKRERAGAGALRARRGPLAALLAVIVAAAVVVVVVLGGSSSSKPGGALSSTALAEVPTNHVTGSGNASVRLKGNLATFTVTTSGLDYNDQLVHPFHIHTGGKGVCPPASAARSHNGHLTISTTDGIKYYGPPTLALTTRGDTSPGSILAFPRYLTGGTLHYSRTITVSAEVAQRIRENNAVVIVHGTDYDNSGAYTGVLERSELNKNVPATETAPALCGPLVRAAKTAAAGPAGRGGALVYTASLSEDPAIPLGELFLCEGGEATAAPAKPGRGAVAARA